MTGEPGTGLRVLGVFVSLLVLSPPATAQDASELARQTQNPVASLISVPFQSNFDFGLGDRDATGTLLNIQPVMPFPISSGTNIILRIIMPLTSQPASGGGRTNGLSDIVATAFFSPSEPHAVTWGAGPVFLLPSGTNSTLSAEKFGIGPSVVVLVQPAKWTLGLLFNHIWSTSGANDRSDVNSTFLQPFVNYNLGDGLAVGASMEATGNWEADEAWTAPLVFNISKVTMLGTRPTQFTLGAGPTVASPESGASWRFRLAATFLYPR